MDAILTYLVPLERENAEIARGLRRRDMELLDRLIEQYQHRLLRLLVYLTGDRALAEDLFQETWVRVLERGSQYDGKRSFSTWLFAVARNLAIDNMRRKKMSSIDAPADEESGPMDVVDEAQMSAFDHVAGQQLSERVTAALGTIPSEYREALVLRFQEDLSLEEIAAVVSAPLGTVKSRIYRGLNLLGPRLKGARR